MAYFLLVTDCMHKNVICTWTKCYFRIFVRTRVHPGKNWLLVASNFQANKSVKSGA